MLQVHHALCSKRQQHVASTRIDPRKTSNSLGQFAYFHLQMHGFVQANGEAQQLAPCRLNT
jgi:hypothetical protein